MDNYTFRLLDTIEVSFEGSVHAQVEVTPKLENSSCGCDTDPGDGTGCAPSDCASGGCGGSCGGGGEADLERQIAATGRQAGVGGV